MDGPSPEEVARAIKTAVESMAWMQRRINRRRLETGSESPLTQLQLDALRTLVRYSSRKLEEETP